MNRTMPAVSRMRDIAYGLAAVATAPVWGWRMLRTGKWRTDWAGRFGRTPTHPQDRPTLLIHAVSVGEVNAIRQLVTKLHERHRDALRIVISTTTDTGAARARELFEPTHTVVRYPLDFTGAVRRFLRAIRPDAVALVELELWPTFMHECERRAVPVVVINGRLSERSHRRYRLIRPLVRGSFARLTAAAVQEQDYADRFVDLGTAPGRVVVTGTMKWDTALIRDEIPGSDALARAMGINRHKPLIVCGSTGNGEERLLVEALRGIDAQLLIAPRKPERFGEASAVMDNPVRRSMQPDHEPGPAAGRRQFLLDTLGELGKAYALADVVIVGRTFSRQGGSDMIEPIALGKATVVGPHVDNFRATVEALRAGGGIVQVADITDLAGAVRDLLSDTVKRRRLAERGREVIRRHQGATDRHVELIESLLPDLKAAS